MSCSRASVDWCFFFSRWCFDNFMWVLMLLLFKLSSSQQASQNRQWAETFIVSLGCSFTRCAGLTFFGFDVLLPCPRVPRHVCFPLWGGFTSTFRFLASSDVLGHFSLSSRDTKGDGPLSLLRMSEFPVSHSLSLEERAMVLLVSAICSFYSNKENKHDKYTLY